MWCRTTLKYRRDLRSPQAAQKKNVAAAAAEGNSAVAATVKRYGSGSLFVRQNGVWNMPYKPGTESHKKYAPGPNEACIISIRTYVKNSILQLFPSLPWLQGKQTAVVSVECDSIKQRKESDHYHHYLSRRRSNIQNTSGNPYDALCNNGGTVTLFAPSSSPLPCSPAPSRPGCPGYPPSPPPLPYPCISSPKIIDRRKS